MNQEVITQAAVPEAGLQSDNRRGKVMAWMVIGVIVLPMIAAYLIFKTGFGIPTGTVNNGELIVPATSVAELDIVDEERQTATWLQTPKAGFKWRLVVIGDGTCNEACESQLYKTRQVHKRLADKARRVERVYLSTSSELSEGFAVLLNTEYPRMAVGWVNPQSIDQLFAETSLADVSNRVLVVDQQGYAMMSYSEVHSGGEMLDDIKRLLKYSYDG